MSFINKTRALRKLILAVSVTAFGATEVHCLSPARPASSRASRPVRRE